MSKKSALLLLILTLAIGFCLFAASAYAAPELHAIS